MSQLAIAKKTGRSRTAVRRVVALLGRGVEAWFQSVADGFRGYGRVGGLGYAHFSVRHSGGVYVAGTLHVNGAESRNWHLRAFLLFKRGVSLWRATFYALAASAFVRLYADATPQAYHWLLEVINHVT